MITVGDGVMASDVTEHTAWRCGQWWRVSWLPGRDLTLYEADVALILAEDVARGDAVQSWVKHRIEDLAEILRLSPVTAAAACERAPQ